MQGRLSKGQKGQLPLQKCLHKRSPSNSQLLVAGNYNQLLQIHPCSSQLHVNIIKLEIEREAIRERSNNYLMELMQNTGLLSWM